jgi:acyl carrier protein
MEIDRRIRAFIQENFVFDDGANLGDEDSFLEEGILDSTGILELVAFLEETFEIQLKDEELIPENLDSINKVVRFLREKLGP